MKTREIKSVTKLIFGSKLIGWGTTALCFLLPNGKVFKLYYDSERTRYLFSQHIDDLNDFYEYLNSFNNNTFIAPEEIIKKNGKVIGYIMSYADGKVISKMNNKYKIEDIRNMIEYLSIDVLEASKRNLRLYDLHQKNIMVGNIFQVIDLDNSSNIPYFSEKDLMRTNMGDLLFYITKALFNINDGYDVYFKLQELDDYYKNATYKDYLEYYKLLDKLSHYGNTLEEIRNEGIVYSLKHVDYYGRY